MSHRIWSSNRIGLQIRSLKRERRQDMKDERKNDMNKNREEKGAVRIDDDTLGAVSGGSLSEVVKEPTKDIDDDTAQRI